MSTRTLLIAIVCLMLGFTCAYLIFGFKQPQLTSHLQTKAANDSSALDNDDAQTNTDDELAMGLSENSDIFKTRFESIENNIALMQQQLQEIEFSIIEQNETSKYAVKNSGTPAINRVIRARTRSYNIETLRRGGLSTTVAEDIMRRKNAVEIQRLELSDRATREDYLNSQRYFDELAEIDKGDVNLREELGDDQYDEYLYTSKQTNRIKILTVMQGSTAEQAGIEKNDIVLSYDNKRMFTWSDLKQATAEGELGDYTSINVSRNGEVFSFSVLRGTLGIQMGATRTLP